MIGAPEGDLENGAPLSEFTFDLTPQPAQSAAAARDAEPSNGGRIGPSARAHLPPKDRPDVIVAHASAMGLAVHFHRCLLASPPGRHGPRWGQSRRDARWLPLTPFPRGRTGPGTGCQACTLWFAVNRIIRIIRMNRKRRAHPDDPVWQPIRMSARGSCTAQRTLCPCLLVGSRACSYLPRSTPPQCPADLDPLLDPRSRRACRDRPRP